MCSRARAKLSTTPFCSEGGAHRDRCPAGADAQLADLQERPAAGKRWQSQPPFPTHACPPAWSTLQAPFASTSWHSL